MPSPTRRRAAVLVLGSLVLGGCLRAPLGGESLAGDTDGTTDGGTSEGSGADGLSVSSTTPAADADQSSTGGSDDTSVPPAPACHPSYDPCLPVLDDLDCADVRALGAAPVQVIGPDDYDLDADHDGIGCET